jgi:endoribonuclease L-PSP
VRCILTKLKTLLTEVDAGLEHVVKARGFLVDAADFVAMDEAWGEFFETKISRTFVSTTKLPVGGARVCFDFMIRLPGHDVEMVRANAGAAPPLLAIDLKGGCSSLQRGLPEIRLPLVQKCINSFGKLTAAERDSLRESFGCKKLLDRSIGVVQQHLG